MMSSKKGKSTPIYEETISCTGRVMLFFKQTGNTINIEAHEPPTEATIRHFRRGCTQLVCPHMNEKVDNQCGAAPLLDESSDDIKRKPSEKLLALLNSGLKNSDLTIKSFGVGKCPYIDEETDIDL